MKKNFFVSVLLLIGCTSFAFEPPLLKGNRPPRMIKFSDPVEITAGKIEIVVPGGSPKTVHFAASELRSFLEQRLGGKIAVAEHPSAGKLSLILGLNRLSAAAGIVEEKLCRDSFIIRASGKNIFIAGRDDASADPEKALKGNKYNQSFERGTLFGVYDFLERFAGIRFYFPGRYGVIVPSGKMQIPRSIDIFDRPDLEVRQSGLEESVFTESPEVISRPYVDRNNFQTHRGQINPQKFLGGWRMRFSSKMLPICHGLNFLDLGKRFASSNPEFFAMDHNGKRLTDPKRPHPFQLCFSSGVRKIILEDIEAFFRNQTPKSRGISPHIYGRPVKIWHPHGFCSGVADLQPQDALYKCRCPKCSRIKTPRQISDMIWDLAIDAAESLKKKKLPGTIQMMSYYPYNLMPERRIPDNFIVQLAVSGPWRFEFGTKLQQQDKVVANWSEKCKKSLVLWNYCGKYGSVVMPDIPHHTPRRIGYYYKRIAPYISGSKLLLSGDYYLFAAMNYYMYAKVAWNNSIDPDELLDEYYRLMFGAGAGEMKKVFNALEENWINANGRVVETPLGPTGIAASQYEIFEIYYSPQFLQNMEQSFNRAEKLASSDKKAFERIKFMRWNFLERIQRASAEYFRNASALRHFKARGAVADSAKVDWSKVHLVYLQRLDGGKNFETFFKAAITPEHLKFRIECREPQPDKVIAAPGDDPAKLWDKNGIELFISPSGDRKNYFQLVFSSAGVRNISFFRMEGSKFIYTAGKAPEYKAAVRVLPDRSIYEIDFKLNDLKGFDRKKLVFNAIRNQKRSDMQGRYSWSPFLGRTNHDLLKFGFLEFSIKKDKNLLSDSDFSAPQKERNVFGPWITNWKIPAGCKVAHDNSTFISGSRSLRITSTQKVKWFQIGQKVKLAPGTRYRLSYFVKLDNVKGLERESGFCVNLWSDRNRWFPAIKLRGTTPWIRQSFEFTTGKKEKRLFQVKPFMHSCSGSVNIDCISLEKLP